MSDDTPAKAARLAERIQRQRIIFEEHRDEVVYLRPSEVDLVVAALKLLTAGIVVKL